MGVGIVVGGIEETLSVSKVAVVEEVPKEE